MPQWFKKASLSPLGQELTTFRQYISLFSLYTDDYPFSDFRFHPSVSPKIGLEVREDAAGLSVRASVSAGLRMAADRHSVWILSSLLTSCPGAELNIAVGMGPVS